MNPFLLSFITLILAGVLYCWLLCQIQKPWSQWANKKEISTDNVKPRSIGFMESYNVTINIQLLKSLLIKQRNLWVFVCVSQAACLAIHTAISLKFGPSMSALWLVPLIGSYLGFAFWTFPPVSLLIAQEQTLSRNCCGACLCSSEPAIEPFPRYYPKPGTGGPGSPGPSF